MAYRYVVTSVDDGSKRLIEASSPAVAIAHVAKAGYTAERISNAVSEMIGIPLEQVKTAAE